MPSSYLLSTTKVCILDAAAGHKQKLTVVQAHVMTRVCCGESVMQTSLVSLTVDMFPVIEHLWLCTKREAKSTKSGMYRNFLERHNIAPTISKAYFRDRSGHLLWKLKEGHTILGTCLQHLLTLLAVGGLEVQDFSFHTASFIIADSESSLLAVLLSILTLRWWRVMRSAGVHGVTAEAKEKERKRKVYAGHRPVAACIKERQRHRQD
eukprot:58089-Pelagomonas_calceolata.AAC.2